MIELEYEPITDEEREAFLEFIRGDQACSTLSAARHAGRKRKEFKELLREDDEFAADYREARGYSDEVVRAEIKRRAIDGVDEPVFHAGAVVGHIRRYSDPLLKAMAAAWLPEYADIRRLELTGAAGGPVRVEHSGTDVAELRLILGEAGAFEVVDGEAVEDPEALGALPGASELLPARPAREPETGGLPPLPGP